MALELQLLEAIDQRLNGVSLPFTDEEFAQGIAYELADYMLAMCRGEVGRDDKRRMVGLAAPQLGVLKQLIVIDLADDPRSNPPDLVAIANPQIVARSEATNVFMEGCFSTSRICGGVPRYSSVTVSGRTPNGGPLTLRLDDDPPRRMSARIAQHETDHLFGFRFPDRVIDPKMLHWVPTADFQRYRQEWQTWPEHVSIGDWQSIRGGRLLSR